MLELWLPDMLVGVCMDPQTQSCTWNDVCLELQVCALAGLQMKGFGHVAGLREGLVHPCRSNLSLMQRVAPFNRAKRPKSG